MPYTVSRSFQTFQTTAVDLAPEDVEQIGAAVDYLDVRLGACMELLGDSPLLHSGVAVTGAVARKTAIRPLGEVELVWLLSAEDALPVVREGQQLQVCVVRRALLLGQRATTEETSLTARGVLATAVTLLAQVPGSQTVCTEADGQAITLELAGYPWVFRVTPVLLLRCDPPAGPLCPEPGGGWHSEAAPSAFDQLPDLDSYHNDLLLPLIRLIKYWNANYHSIPGLPAGYLEALLIDSFSDHPPLTDLKRGLLSAFRSLADRLALPHSEHLPGLDRPASQEVCAEMSEKALVMAQFIQHALYYEQQGDQEEAIGWWRLLFFPDFPAYDG